MSEQVETLRTAAELLAEATRYVNFKPDEKHSQQARYDALQALTSTYAYCTVVALETLRRIDPAAAERVAEHCGLDDWQAKAENAAMWGRALANRRGTIDPNSRVFTHLAGPYTEETE